MASEQELKKKLDDINTTISDLRDRSAKALARVEVLQERIEKDSKALEEMGIDLSNLDETIESLHSELAEGQAAMEEVLSSLEEEVRAVESAVSIAGGTG